MVYIIGFSGKIGSGKNYIAEHILPTILPQNIIPIYLAFADQLKIEVYARDKTNTLNYNNLYIDKTPDIRRKLQIYGTEIGREEKKNMWIDALHMWITVFQNRWNRKDLIPLFIITDVRFVNEAEYILKQNGVLYRIDAPYRTEEKLLKELLNSVAESNNDSEYYEKYQEIKFHRSEISLDNFNFNYHINNDNGRNNNDIINELKSGLSTINFN